MHKQQTNNQLNTTSPIVGIKSHTIQESKKCSGPSNLDMNVALQMDTPLGKCPVAVISLGNLWSPGRLKNFFGNKNVGKKRSSSQSLNQSNQSVSLSLSGAMCFL